MALELGNDITPEALIQRFQTAVVDTILDGVYHAGNPPMCRGFQCVPTSKMDHINNVNKMPHVGNKKEIINADTILNGLIETTRALTRVGTFAFTVNMRESSEGVDRAGRPHAEYEHFNPVDSKAGKVLFTADYVKEFGRPADIAGTSYGQPIKASNLNRLLSNIYQAWMATDRPKHSGSCIICHIICHWNCHYNCHRNCHSSCHGWTIIRNQ